MNEAAALLNREFALALGLPKGTKRATLHLQVDQLPRLEVECNEEPLRLITDPSTGARKLATLHFMLRLEPFTPTNEDPP